MIDARLPAIPCPTDRTSNPSARIAVVMRNALMSESCLARSQVSNRAHRVSTMEVFEIIRSRKYQPEMFFLIHICTPISSLSILVNFPSHDDQNSSTTCLCDCDRCPMTRLTTATNRASAARTGPSSENSISLEWSDGRRTARCASVDSQSGRCEYVTAEHSIAG